MCNHNEEADSEETESTENESELHSCYRCGDGYEHLEECVGCSCEICNDCLLVCECSDDKTLCLACVEECNHCESPLCEECRSYDDYTEQYYCASCYDAMREERDREEEEEEEEDTIDLYDYSYSPRLLCHECKPDSWIFVKERWENTLFLGVELEMAFPESSFLTMANISKEYFYGKHIWKRDGSINLPENKFGPGGELVITPHTLQAFTKINLKEMLVKFSDVGARSYEANTCGLHIHTNREEVSDRVLSRLRKFFCENKDWVVKFSQRTETSLDRWAAIPDTWDSDAWNHDRYVALNKTEETIEFRVFRGTLDYERFKATLQFVDAIIYFVKQHSLMAVGKLSHFKEFLDRGPYHVLNNYLKKKGL